MVYYTTLVESQRVMHFLIIIGEFGFKIQHTSGVYNILVDMLRRLPYVKNNQEDTITIRYQHCANKLFKNRQ